MNDKLVLRDFFNDNGYPTQYDPTTDILSIKIISGMFDLVILTSLLVQSNLPDKLNFVKYLAYSEIEYRDDGIFISIKYSH